MKDTLQPGIEHRFTFDITDRKTVPALFPESEEFQQMPEVFATGYMVGFLEWTCIQAVNPYLDWPDEQTVGIGINVNHTAATPPGMSVTAEVKLMEVDGRRLVFEVAAHDDAEPICKGIHERFVIDKERFSEKVLNKMESNSSVATVRKR
jgi:fluoroacetyl-CoA thioesterase